MLLSVTASRYGRPSPATSAQRLPVGSFRLATSGVQKGRCFSVGGDSPQSSRVGWACFGSRRSWEDGLGRKGVCVGWAAINIVVICGAEKAFILVLPFAY